ncbi:MAG: biotin--[acetyl-CoA-carboxylase] ligase [Planctomycetaceae bacterium]
MKSRAWPGGRDMGVGGLTESLLFGGVEWHAEIDSTNTRALACAGRAELRTPYVVGADLQTAGRGRGGNRWWSATGALLVSVVLDPARDFGGGRAISIPTSSWPRLSLVAAVAWCDVLDELRPKKRVGLKWPNDVHWGGRKIAGILLESPPPMPGVGRRLVLGMGLNVNNTLAGAPAEVAEVATSLVDATGATHDREELLLEWMGSFWERVAMLAEEDPGLPEAWHARCVLAGSQVTLQSGGNELAGLCLGIDDSGALLIDTPTGTQRCHGGVLVRSQGRVV